MLLLSAEDHAVGRDRVVQVVYDGKEVVNETIYQLVSRLRHRLLGVGLAEALITDHGTYRLEVAPEQVDLHRFRVLSAHGRSLIGEDDHRADELLSEALKLRRGVPLSGLNGTWIDSYRYAIDEEFHMTETALYELRHPPRQAPGGGA